MLPLFARTATGWLVPRVPLSQRCGHLRELGFHRVEGVIRFQCPIRSAFEWRFDPDDQDSDSLGAVMRSVSSVVCNCAANPRCNLPRTTHSQYCYGHHHRCIKMRPIPIATEMASSHSIKTGIRLVGSREVWNKRRRVGITCQSTACRSHPMRADRPELPRLLYPMARSVLSSANLVLFNSVFLLGHSRTACAKRYPICGGIASSIWIMSNRCTNSVYACG